MRSCGPSRSRSKARTRPPTPTRTASPRLASEVDGLIDRVLKAANSQPDGKSVFAGTAITTAPFRVATTDAQGRPATIAYDGAPERTRALTGPNQTVDTRYTGTEVFQQPGADVFQSLIGLRDALRDTSLSAVDRSAAFQTRIASLDAARDGIADVTAEQASALATLQSIESLTSDVKLTADARIGDLSGTDFAEAVVKMQENETALQAIYATTAKLLSPGLLDFIADRGAVRREGFDPEGVGQRSPGQRPGLWR